MSWSSGEGISAVLKPRCFALGYAAKPKDVAFVVSEELLSVMVAHHLQKIGSFADGCISY